MLATQLVGAAGVGGGPGRPRDQAEPLAVPALEDAGARRGPRPGGPPVPCRAWSPGCWPSGPSRRWWRAPRRARGRGRRAPHRWRAPSRPARCCSSRRRWRVPERRARRAPRRRARRRCCPTPSAVPLVVVQQQEQDVLRDQRHAPERNCVAAVRDTLLRSVHEQDPVRRRLAVCQRPAPHRPRGRFRRALRRVQPLHADGGPRRAHGLRHRRARHADPGRGRRARVSPRASWRTRTTP